MRPLGTVLHAIPRDLLVVEARSAVQPGTKVVDRDRRPVGVVKDVIGPVASPYLVVRTRGDPARFAGVGLYAK